MGAASWGCRLTPICRRVKVRKLLLVGLSFMACLNLYNWAMKEYDNPAGLNYFMDADVYGRQEYMVNTENCKILKLSPWDPAILDFIKPKIKPPDCSQRNNGKRWIHVVGSEIHINETDVRASGYSLSSIRCCYKGILRVEQTLAKFDWDADNLVRYTETCTPMGTVTRLEYEFARVFCTSTSWPYLGEVVYREYLAVPVARGESSLKKLEFWADKIKKEIRGDQLSPSSLPPSIVMLGIDSLSRMNYHRSFNLTKTFLDGIGAVELVGYTKIGENTFPNTAAFLTGYDPASDPELREGCIKTSDTPQDFCPFIWKRFGDAGYLTATVEDAPGLVGFNYLKLGFVEKPTDFYFRPFMLQVHKSLPRKDYYHTDCIGSLTTEETLLNYISGIMSHSSASAPVFIHSWMTSLAHLDINGARFADSTLVNFLSSVDLSNTILIFLSDHGQRYGAIRETLAGWYEDKLPILSIYLPPTVRRKFPDWEVNLRTNAERLSSPFDLYQMMEHVLDAYTPKGKEVRKKPPNTRGQSLFEPISPLRKCSDAGIKVNFCACLPPRKVNSSDPQLLEAGEAAVGYLNSVLNTDASGKCAPAELDRIVAGGVMMTGNGDEGEEEGTFLVTFYTNPGRFLFEASVDFRSESGESKRRRYNVTTDLLRMNKISRPANCVSTSLLERYCYCK